MTTCTLEDLQAALTRHNVDVDEDALPLLRRYCELLWHWNEKINLTRHTDEELFVTRDLIDSLRLAGHLQQGESVLDVGSGGGVPGIVLGIVRPDLDVSMAESVGKKARFLKAITKKMHLDVAVHSARAEDVLKKRQYNTLTIRAVASLRKLLFWLQRREDAFGRILMIKGPRWKEEYAEAEEEGLLENVTCEVIDEYSTPGRDNASVILSVTYASPE